MKAARLHGLFNSQHAWRPYRPLGGREALKRLTLWANYQPGQNRNYDENAINEKVCLKTRAMLAQACMGATAWKEAIEAFHAC